MKTNFKKFWGRVTYVESSKEMIRPAVNVEFQASIKARREALLVASRERGFSSLKTPLAEFAADKSVIASSRGGPLPPPPTLAQVNSIEVPRLDDYGGVLRTVQIPSFDPLRTFSIGLCTAHLTNGQILLLKGMLGIASRTFPTPSTFQDRLADAGA